MRLFRDFHSLPADAKGVAIAIGNFDGVHLGHQAILKRCVEIAKKNNIPAAAMTFEPHPRRFFGKGGVPLTLYPLRRKIELLRDLGIEILFLVRFNAALASLTAEDFVEKLLVGQLAAKHIITGEDFGFGKGRGGDATMLAQLAKQHSFGFTACPKVLDKDGQVISSTAIRKALELGDMEKASTLLGRPYAIEGRVRRGFQRGQKLGFPTANLSLGRLFRPRFGIYAVRLDINRSGEWQDGVASLGTNPMFEALKPLLETHGFGIKEPLYGKWLRVALIRFIRNEARFENEAALIAQMRKDCTTAKEMLDASR